jgi:two-component system OmpR family sensor kinase
MSLKFRLTLAFTALLVAVTAVLGYVVVAVNRTAGIQRIDDQLNDFVSGGGLRALRQIPSGPPDGVGPGRGAGEVTTVSYLWDASSGTWVSLVPNVDALVDAQPVLPAPDSAEFTALLDDAGTLTSADGTQQFRVRTVITNVSQGAVATSLKEVNRSSRALIRIVLVSGLIAVLISAMACWWVIRRALRPVDRMVDTAQAIAQGDLSQRVEHPDDGSELGRLGAALDDMLTQLEADADERERANARLQQFVADASHELRTPVAAVRGYAELFRAGGVPPGEPTQVAMQRIETESVRMGRLIDDLLLLARLDQDVALTLDTVNLTRVVEDAAAAFQVIHPGRSLVTSIDEGVMVRGDAVRLRQVIDNLLANAGAHSDDDAEVRIAVTAPAAQEGGASGFARVVVSDDGPGIPFGQRDAVFERFTRLDDSRARQTGGAGLGLSIVAAIVAAHGGAVSVGEAASGGAEFTVTVPVDGPSRVASA